MPDDSLENSVTLICGKSGYCKTTFGLNLMLNSKPAVRIIFDWKKGEISRRLNKRLVATRDDCEDALASRWVCFSPHLSTNNHDALNWLAQWAGEVSNRGPGAKLFYVDEWWQFKDGRGKPPKEVEGIARGLSRGDGLQLISSTQNPRDYSLDVLSQVTEWVCFRTELEEDLKVIRNWFPDVDMVRDFPPGRFVAYNVQSGAISHGQLEPGWPPGRFLRLTR